MDGNRLEGKWKQFKGRVQEQWGVLLDDKDKEREGHREYIIGKIKEKSGETRDAIRSKLRSIEASL